MIYGFVCVKSSQDTGVQSQTSNMIKQYECKQVKEQMAQEPQIEHPYSLHTAQTNKHRPISNLSSFLLRRFRALRTMTNCHCEQGAGSRTWRKR